MEKNIILAKRYMLHEIIPPTADVVVLTATDMKTNMVVAVKLIRKSDHLQAYNEIVDYYKMGLDLACDRIQRIYDVLESGNYIAIVFQKM